MLALRSVHCLIFAAAMLLLIEASTAQIGESISSDQQSNSIICNDNYLVNSYYLIPNKDIQSVAGFYNNAGPFLFLDTHLFSLYKVGRNRVDTYFDTQNLSLLGQKKELLISLDVDLPAYRLGKEQVISIDSALLPLRIAKYESKYYNRKLSSLDKHPLFGKVKRKERQTLMSSIGTG